MRKLLSIILPLGLCIVFATSAWAPVTELVENGDFEAPVVTATQGWDIFDSGYSGLGWTVEWRDDVPGSWGGWNRPDPAHLELHNGVNNWSPYDGSQHAELDTDWNDHVGTLNNEPAAVRIYQDLETCIAGEYELKFAWSPRPNHSDNVLWVYWDGSLIATYSGSGSGMSNTNWTLETHSDLTVSGELTRLEFVEKGTLDSLGMFLDAVSVIQTAPCYFEVDLDIKPGSYPNCFNPDGHGVIPVAILGSADFDVTLINVTTLEFGSLTVRVKGNGDPQCSVKDVSGDFSGSLEGKPDGFDDLVCQFIDDSSFIWNPGDGEATLTGELFDGTPIQGADSICIVPAS